MLPQVLPEVLPQVLPQVLPEVLPQVLPEVLPEVLPQVSSPRLGAQQRGPGDSRGIIKKAVEGVQWAALRMPRP